jgi:NhaA family Na+:H+ antiporter
LGKCNCTARRITTFSRRSRILEEWRVPVTDQSSGHGGPRSPRRVERPLPGRALPLATAFRRFAQAQASGGIVLLAAIVVALIWANMPGGSYEWVWNSEIVVGIRGASAEFTLQDVVNQGLMAFFFLLVTLEIKREVLVGELTPPRRAVLPLLAAVGGMALPALIYLVVNLGRNSQGWAIPIATDIALVGGVMALLGRRLSTPVQVFMLALAIVDDILAILVIAIFYTGAVSPFPVVMLAVLALVLALMNCLGVRYVWIW